MLAHLESHLSGRVIDEAKALALSLLGIRVPIAVDLGLRALLRDRRWRRPHHRYLRDVLRSGVE